jgi:sugar lactone lactonase YvrE
MFKHLRLAGFWLLSFWALTGLAHAADNYIFGTATAIPKWTTTEMSGYFSIIEGKNGKIYIGTAKYQHNAYLVEFDPTTKEMKVVIDAHKEIGLNSTGFAAQAKIHTRNNVGPSGKIYCATKQGYPQNKEPRTAYLGGYPLVYDPATGKTRVYSIPVPHQGIISITPDESRNVAYISTCSDGRPVESSHFMILDLATGKYRDLIESEHSYAFIVVDYLGRAYHPLRGGDIARFDPRTDKLERLKQTVDGKAPSSSSHLADAHNDVLNWDITPDGKTMYCVAMSGNQLYSFDLTQTGPALNGKSLGTLLPDVKGNTDCRAMCVGPHGDVWADVLGDNYQHLVTYHPGDAAPRDLGRLAVRNPDYTDFTDSSKKPHIWHHGLREEKDGTKVPLYHMGVCEGHDGKVYVTYIYPYTVLQIDPKHPGK